VGVGGLWCACVWCVGLGDVWVWVWVGVGVGVGV